MRKIIIFCFLFSITAFYGALSQERSDSQIMTRSSIPEELLRPSRAESARYPIDTVIGELGQGSAPASGFSFANYVLSGFLSGQIDNPALTPINSNIRQEHISALSVINPRNFRIGGGREEADGAYSFLVRFIGRDQGITGELYIRYITRSTEVDGEIVTTGNWAFEELLLEEARDREIEQQESIHRIDLYPYERFF